ncbi:uncharacterized protein LOC135478299 isoform X2 [Liolophura sinensis]|uniref:uncharacterized protein LOC135478299 isoform X2 n=1 Tax=Liolophura sinensis TaxID=3198878 RepID=UPI003158D066
MGETETTRVDPCDCLFESWPRGFRKGSRPRLPLPSLEVCDTRHSLHDDGTRSNASNEERLFGHGRYGGNTQSGDADAQLYENTTQRKKNSPTPPTPCLTPHYYNVRNNGRKKPTIKPKPRLILGPSKNGGFAKKAQPIGQMSPGQPSYIDILPDSDSGEFGQAYSYVPTQWPPGGNTPRPAPPTRQTSECSMNYYNMPTDSSYQNVETKFQS